jgi:hypothetical protein
MKQSIISALGITIRSPGNPLKRQMLIVLGFIVPFLCFLFLGIRYRTHSEIAYSDDMDITPVTTTSSTKWWIKTTVPSTATPSSQDVPGTPTDLSADRCTSSFPSQLQPGTYGYISLVPPLPNRVRASAGKANAYLGQIQPGVGVQIIDGPLCVDGFSWWLVETVESDLRGWTVAGSKSDQWVLPCPNSAVACKMSPVIQQATPTTTHSPTPGTNDHTCTSNRIFIGMPTQVKEDNLLVVRSEPYTGSIIGHAGPTSAVTIVDGPACAGGAVWWEVNVPSLNLAGWVTEANLQPCTKEDDCN